MPDMNRRLEQATAARLAAALDQYDQQRTEMLRTWLDMEVYAAVSKLVDEMRPSCNRLPLLSAPWAAFLISHSELVFRLWRAGSGNSGSPEVQACAREHAACLRNLRQSCARLCDGDQGGPASPSTQRSAPHRAPRSSP